MLNIKLYVTTIEVLKRELLRCLPDLFHIFLVASENTPLNFVDGHVNSGGIAGAIVGGPIGFIVGAATGAWAGNKFNKEREARADAEGRATVAETRAAEAERLAVELEHLVAGNEDQIESLNLVLRRQEDTYRDALQQALANRSIEELALHVTALGRALAQAASMEVATS